ncbi:MAG: hypothetical protein OXT71_08535 [Acidobacteriota bacterium]|nr:hypothetical protein [Acidobacteriota bacterium]
MTPRQLDPLADAYSRRGLRLPAIERVEGLVIPQPYRDLLVHDRDMTPTLEAFHGEPIHLRVVSRGAPSGILFREVVLITAESARPVEFGAIRIRLDGFGNSARELILEGLIPLGTILKQMEIPHRSDPRRYFRVEPDQVVARALEMEGREPLYGRHNLISSPDGRVLAEMVEILPPWSG